MPAVGPIGAGPEVHVTDSPSLRRYQRMRTITHTLERATFLGYRALAKHRVAPGRHSVTISEATYSPWNLDSDFLRAYDRVREHTLVDKRKVYGLWDYARQVRHLPGDILEVGVWRGGTGALLALASQGGAERPHVYLCDTYAGMPETDGTKDTFYKGGELADTSVDIVRGLVDGLHLDDVELCQGLFPQETGSLVTSERFKLVHIDVDIYESARDTVDFVWDKLVPGGLIVFDDYGYSATEGVTRYVDEELRGRPGSLFVYNVVGHGIVVKTAGLALPPPNA
jgi:O-methyltransferase